MRVSERFDTHLCQTIGYQDGFLDWCIFLIQVPLTRLEEIWLSETESFPELSQNLFIVLFVDSPFRGNIMYVDDALAVEERGNLELPKRFSLVSES